MTHGYAACQCRTLLPGLDLAEHGLQELQGELVGPGGVRPAPSWPWELARPGTCAPEQLVRVTCCARGMGSHPRPTHRWHAGGDLTVVSAPPGMDLREAISSALSQPHLQPGRDSAAVQQQLYGSLPGTPASLPCGLASAAAVSPADLPSGTAQDEQQQRRHAGTSDEQQVAVTAGDETSWQWLLRGRFPAPDDAAAGSAAQACQPAMPGARAGALAAPPAAASQPGGSEGAMHPGQRPRATTLDQLELVQSAAPVARPEGARHWSYDGAGAALGAPRSLKPSPLEVTYRAQAAGWWGLGAACSLLARQLQLVEHLLSADTHPTHLQRACGLCWRPLCPACCGSTSYRGRRRLATHRGGPLLVFMGVLARGMAAPTSTP